MVPGFLDRPGDFDGWVMPGAALRELASLIGGRWPAAREIEARLKVGQMVAIARSAHRFQGTQEKGVTALALLNIDIWQAVHGLDDPRADFWVSGRLETTRSVDGGRSSAMKYTFLDVRFYPHSVAMIPAIKQVRATSKTPAEQPAPVQPPKRPAPVPGDKVTAWYQALAEADKALGLRALWAKAKAEVGPGVVRKQIEPFVAGRQTGPKGPRG